MWYQSTTERVIGLFESLCGYCGEMANFRLSREEDFFIFLVIPFWSTGNYYITCGNCHSTFKLKRKEGKTLEREILGYTEGEKRLSNVKKNLIVLGILVGLLMALFTL